MKGPALGALVMMLVAIAALIYLYFVCDHWKPGNNVWAFSVVSAIILVGLALNLRVPQKGWTAERIMSIFTTLVMFPLLMISGACAFLWLLKYFFQGHGITPFM
jgi:hypothetical protein